MTIWTAEIKDLEKLSRAIREKHPKLEKELSKLVKTDDENMALVYARRCLEVIIAELCERELKRKRGSDPMQGIIDRLNREEKVPHHIIVSMRNLNSVSNFGAHPKEFDPQQVKPALLDLNTILRWYSAYIETAESTTGAEGKAAPRAITAILPKKNRQHVRKRILIPAIAIVAAAVILLFLVKFLPDRDLPISQPVKIEALAVLPFDNYTGDDQLDYVAAGLHASLIGDLGKVGALRVSGKTSSSAFRDTNLQASEIASRLGVDALLEPSVLCYGDSVCIQISLVTPFPEERQLWVAEFREDKSQIVQLFNHITKQIAEEIMVQLTPEEERLLSKSISIDRDALDAYLMSHEHWDDLNEDSVRKAIDYLNYAAEKETEWAPIFVGLAQLWGILLQIGAESPADHMPTVFMYLNKAKELDPDFTDIHFNYGIFAVWLDWDWEKGEKEFKKALAINPSDAMSRIYYAHLLGILQRNEEALLQGRIAAELEPYDPLIQSLFGVVLAFNRDWKAALEQLEKALELDPGHFFATQLIDAVAIHLEDYDRILQAWESYLPFPAHTFDTIRILYHEQGFRPALAKVTQELIQAEYGGPWEYAMRYNMLQEYDNSLDWLEKAYEIHDPNLPYLATGTMYLDSLYNNPRFIAILDQMNLPMPSLN